jgi:23S rRNA (adenine2503-C2)-methyltransferase
MRGMQEKPVLFNMADAELEQFLAGLGQPRFRAKQVGEWLRRGAPNFSVMKNLPESLRLQLDEAAVALPCGVVGKLESGDGRTTKFLLRTWDGPDFIESVLMRTSYGNSVCVSSQIGCAMGCKFCASTLLGLKRSLTANEMLAQVLAAQWWLKAGCGGSDSSAGSGGDVTHIVVMGTGEPLQNTGNVKSFLERANRDLGIGWRRMTVSTCGIVPGIRELSEWGRPINLAISLHAAVSSMRSDLMPIGKEYGLHDVLDAAFEFSDKVGRRLMIEYILLDGTNDSCEDAERLAALLRGKSCMVNLIPWNPVAERNFKAPSGNAVHRFQDILIKNGVHTRIRRERGADIGSACGQLRIGK